MKVMLLFACLAAGLAVSSVRGQSVSETFAGNQNTSFGGAVGTGSLQVSNDALGAINFTYTRGSSNFDNAIVIYIDSEAGGATSTSGFIDTGDGLRRAISGLDGSNRSTLNFTSGFEADYAIALNNSFAGLWSLSNSANFPFKTSAGLTPSSATQTEASYTFGISAADIGLVANSGGAFSFFSSYISESAYRSVETFGASYTGAPTAGWTTFDAAASNTVALVPEPVTSGFLAAAVAAFAGRAAIRRRV
ncbi:MAG: hypothetical protein RLZZ440_601 [Planctomycetota bacterium]|jgi:hypothetical protein